MAGTGLKFAPGSLTVIAALTVTGWSAAHAQSPTEPLVSRAAGAATTAAVNAAPAVDLRVTYYSRAVGHDGVQHDSRYTDRMYRRLGRVWLEREIPAYLREGVAQGHGPRAGPAHDEVQGAPLLLDREASGREIVQVVLAKTRRVIEVDQSHYSNVGYGGSWDAAYWLVSPGLLKRMTIEGPAKRGVQRYVAKLAKQTTTIDWDVAGQFARRVERSDARGATYYLMTAARMPAPTVAPWQASLGFGRGNYSDLLN